MTKTIYINKLETLHDELYLNSLSEYSEINDKDLWNEIEIYEEKLLELIVKEGQEDLLFW